MTRPRLTDAAGDPTWLSVGLAFVAACIAAPAFVLWIGSL